MHLDVNFIYTAKFKKRPIHIHSLVKIVPIHILIIKFYPFIYFSGEKDTPLIYFWCEIDTHSYTWRPEKYTPSSRTSVYNFIMEVNPHRGLQTGRMMVWCCLSVRPGLRPSVTVFHTFLLLWHIELKFGMFFLLMNIRTSSSVVNFNFRQFFWSYVPFGTLNPGNTVFSHFSPTCFDTSSWNFA